MSAQNNQSKRGLVTAVLLLAIAAAGYFLLRPPGQEGRPTGTAEEYVAALGPVVQQAQQLSESIGNEVLEQPSIDAIAALEDEWATVRTGPGYDRATHDDFIIVFGSFVTGLKSAGMLSSHVNNLSDTSPAIPDAKRTEVMFTLQSLYGIETAAQLLARREMSYDELLTRTNLQHEVTNSLANSPQTLARAVRLYEELQQKAPAP